MLPNILNLFFERIQILPSEEITTIIQKGNISTIPKFIDIVVDIVYGPDIANELIRHEAQRVLNAMINSSTNIILLKHLFELQGPMNDEKIKTIQGNKIYKALPQWKQNGFNDLIQQIMLKPNGINNVVKTLLELIGNHRTNAVAFKVAKCICKPPNVIEKEIYYKDLSEQIINLIQISVLSKIAAAKHNDTDIHKEYLKFGQCVGLECLHMYAMINREYARQFLLEPFFKDFLKILSSNIMSEFEEPEIVIDSDSFIDLLSLQNSILSTHKPSLFIQKWLRRFSPIYLAILKVKENTENKFKTVTKEILVKLVELSYHSSHDTHSYVRALSNLDSFDDSEYLNEKLEIRPTFEISKFEVAVKCSSFSPDSSTNDELIAKIMVDVLSGLSTTIKNDVVSTLYIWLLERRLAIDNESCAREIIVPNEFEDRLRSRLLRDTLLYYLCTEMESSCFTRSSDVLRFAQIAISQYSKLGHESSIDKTSKKILLENLNYSLNMIFWVLENGELSDSDQEILKQLFPVLTDLLAKYPHDSITELITGICTVIATKGLVNPLSEKKSALIEEVNDAIDPALLEAFTAVEDDEISYKGFGLAKLRQLLEERNESAIRQRTKIYNIFSHYLFHSDSFIYTRAIRGIALLGDQFTDKLLPAIANKINSCRKILTVENWLVLSEAFIQIVRNLGETAPHYRDVVLNCIMQNLNDDEELVRASACCNLGELCCQLEYAFSSVMFEVMAKVCNLLETDPSSRVKVACSKMIRMLVLGKDDSAPRPEIHSLHSVLKLIRECLLRVMQTETDEIVLDHVSVAYKSMRDSILSVPLFPSKYETKISVGDQQDVCSTYRNFLL